MSSFPQTGQDPQAPPSARSRRFAVAGFVLLLLLNAAAILSLGYFPTLDGPMLLYYAQAFGTLLAGHPAFHSYFQLQHVAGSHLFYFYFVAALSPFLKLTLIEKLFVALYIAWLAYSFYYLVEGIRPGRGLPLALFVLPFALNSTVYSAFYDFAFGAATALFICGWWLRNFDRLNPLRSALAAALLLIVIVMHLMDAAIVALFTSIHVALYGAMQFRLAGGGFARRMGVSFRKTLKPAAHVAAGAALLYAFRPASVGSAQTDPFFQDPLQRLRELAAFRPFSPFESRFYRGLLGIVLISAVAMTVAALWRQRRALSPRAEWAAFVAGAVALAAYLVVPFWMAGGAYFPQRFAVLGAFFLLAAAAVFPLRGKRRRLAAAGAAAVSLAALGYQVHIERMLDQRYAATLRLPPLTGGRIAAIVAEDDFADPALLFNVQLWAGMHYIRRSGLALLNSPWLDVPDNWLRVREPHPCQFLNPVLMRHCLADAEDRPDRPPLDVLVGVRTQPLPGPERRITAAIAGRYGLTRRVWDSPYLSIYARPDVRMSATFGGKP